MSLMEKYSSDEKRAVIAFLNMIISIDSEVRIEELNLVWMLARCINIDLNEVEKMTEDEFRNIMMQLSDDKMLEVLRMSFTLVSLDQKHKEKERKFIESILTLRQEDEVNYKIFYESMNNMTELTPLDQVVLIVLAHYMAEADGLIREGEVQMLIVLCSMIGVDIEEVPLYKIPKDALYQAVFSMSSHAAKRLVEELILICIADFKIAEAEYDFIFPILSHFNMDFEDVLKQARNRLNEHFEYYELFQTESAVN